MWHWWRPFGSVHDGSENRASAGSSASITSGSVALYPADVTEGLGASPAMPLAVDPPDAATSSLMARVGLEMVRTRQVRYMG